MSVVVPLNNCSLMSSLLPSKVFAISAEKSSHNSVVVIGVPLSSVLGSGRSLWVHYRNGERKGQVENKASIFSKQKMGGERQ